MACLPGPVYPMLNAVSCATFHVKFSSSLVDFLKNPLITVMIIHVCLFGCLLEILPLYFALLMLLFLTFPFCTYFVVPVFYSILYTLGVLT